jgi:hypothetical protein
MKLKQIIKNYINNKEPHERKLGRYWASDLWAILNDKLLAEDFYHSPRLTLTACRNIIEGMMREDFLKVMLDSSKIDYEYQTKKVVVVNQDIQLVVVSDFEFQDRVLECKTPVKDVSGIKPYHLPQLEAQYRAFNKEIMIGYFRPRFMAKFYTYQPNNKLWKQIQLKLQEFHQKLSEYSTKIKLDV